MGAILCIGDIMLDVVTRINQDINVGSDTKAQISTHGGGAAANVATWLGHLGADVYLVARVGEDAAGATVLAELDKYKVKHGNQIIKGGRTGVVVVLVDKNGERTMFPDSGANSGIGLSDLPNLDTFSTAYISAYALINPKSRTGVIKIIEELRKSNILIVFDPATVGALKEVGKEEVLNWLLGVDLLLMNLEEADYLTQEKDPEVAIEKLLQFSKTVVIKLGKDGAIAKTRGEDLYRISALPSNVVDTTGAGDSFAAGFISSWQSNGDLNAALNAGTELAAKCVAHIGARPLVAPH